MAIWVFSATMLRREGAKFKVSDKPVSKLKHLLTFSIVSITALLLAGCSNKVVVLAPKGQVAAQEMHLLIFAVLLMLIVVIPVIILTLVIARRYRASNKHAKYSPDFSHSVSLELVWWTVPIIIIAILATVTWKTTHQLDPYKPLDIKGKPVTIQAIALRWKWLFIYPQQNIATVNYVVFPAHRQIRFEITSDAPMNSFQIQQLAGQIYAMNGMRTKIHIVANHQGTYRGRSVSFSGAGFANMRFTAKATSQAQFEQWVDQAKRSPKHLDMNTYEQLVKPTQNYMPPTFYSSVAPDLFNKVIMKFMGLGHTINRAKPLVNL